LINRKGCDVLGYDENEILGKNWFNNFAPVAERKKVQKFFDQLMAGKEIPIGHFENLNLTKDGQQKIISWQIVVLRDENGN
ncbi:MAG: PAS domain-containing protein, partial [Candidatus Aenigmarchaeota archaeon]|nr:PAS domain-containing protein [Candidatus Aenigmarchaeota archaeon]